MSISLDEGKLSVFLRDAIETHKWYLSEKEGRDVGFQVAEEDFIVTYLIPWIESNPPTENLSGNDLNHCSHLRDLMQLQEPAYLKAVRDDQWYLGSKNGHGVDWETAQVDFMDNHLREWGRKFKIAYCGHICPDRNFCSIARNYSNGERVDS